MNFETTLQEFAEAWKRFSELPLQIEVFNNSLIEVDKRLENIIEVKSKSPDQAWREELKEKPAKLNWHGYTEGSRIEYFNKQNISSKCTRPCKECGFYYLSSTGEELKRTDTPLCGVW